MSIAWFIVITLVIVIMQIFVYSRWGLSRIVYTRTFSEKTVFEGEEIEMVDVISNKKLLPVPWIRLEASMSEHLVFKQQGENNNEIKHGSKHQTMFSLMPYQKIKRRHKLTCAKRGRYYLKTVALSTGDVFGFSETFKTVSSPTELIVYPRLIPLDEISLPVHSWLGDITVRRWIMEDPFLTAGVRQYEYGDPMNMVNWKATARTNQLQVDKKDFTADHDLMIYVNFNQTGDVWKPIADEALIERALSYAATVADYAISRGIPTGFGCNSYYTGNATSESIRIESENSNQQLNYLFETMARLQVDSKKSFNFFLEEDVDQKREESDILLITAIMTDKMQEHVGELERLGNSVKVVILENDREEDGIMDEQRKQA